MKIRYGQLHRARQWQVEEWGPQWQEEGGTITLRKIRFLSNSRGRMRESRVEFYGEPEETQEAQSQSKMDVDGV